MSETILINREALARFRHIRDSNARYSIVDESSHVDYFNNGFRTDVVETESWTIATVSSADSVDWSVRPPTMPPKSPNPRSLRSKRISKYHGEHNMKSSPLEDAPASWADRSLRSPGWVGGHSPYGFKKPKRSWRLKNPVDEIYFTQI